MVQLFGLLMAAFAASFVVRIMVGAGLAFTVYNFSTGFINGLIADANAQLDGLTSDMIAILAIAGFGEALSIMVGMAVTIISVSVGGRIAGLKVVS